MKYLLIIFLVIYGVYSRPALKVPFVPLKHLGTINAVNDEGTQYEKKFYHSSYLKTTATHARSVCQSYKGNMDIASFENRNDLQRIQAKLAEEEMIVGEKMIVGGMLHNNNFFWLTEGLKVDQSVANMQSSAGNYCLAIKKVGSSLTFTGIPCETEHKFICQSLEFIYAN